MFKLYCTRMDNQEPVILQYDAKTSTLLDENGKNLGAELKKQMLERKEKEGLQSPPADNHQHDVVKEKAFKFNPDNPIGKTTDIKSLKIQLGLKCNYACSYCSQAEHIVDAEDTNNDDVQNFLDKMDTWITSEPQKIEFWGGEPLVYWKKVQILAPALKAKYPNAQMSIITNGAILTKEIVDYIIQYDMNVTISHDGPGQHLRGPDPLDDEEVKKVWLYLFEQRPFNVGINSVLTAKNHNPAAIRRWFLDKIGDVVQIGLEGIVNSHDNNPEATFTEQDYAELESDIFFALWNGEPPSSALWQRSRNFLNTLATGSDSDYMWQKCGMDQRDQIAVDLLGNAMTCHNTGSKGKHNLGSVYDFENIKLDTSWHWSQRDECSHCPMLQLCSGSCMFLDGNDFAVTCHNEYHYAKPIFAFVLAAFFGYVLLDIQGDIRRPKIRRTIPLVAA